VTISSPNSLDVHTAFLPVRRGDRSTLPSESTSARPVAVRIKHCWHNLNASSLFDETFSRRINFQKGTKRFFGFWHACITRSVTAFPTRRFPCQPRLVVAFELILATVQISAQSCSTDHELDDFENFIETSVRSRPPKQFEPPVRQCSCQNLALTRVDAISILLLSRRRVKAAVHLGGRLLR